MTHPVTRSSLPCNQIICGDAFSELRKLPDGFVQTCVTSPPYYSLRNYGIPGQIGLEETPDEYVTKLVEVFREVQRVLRNDGTCWINLGDSYAANRGYQVPDSKWRDVGNSMARQVPSGLKPKDLIGVPWLVAFALRADGWYLRSDIIWSKPNAMPESVEDRPTKSHEYLFLLSKSERYFYDADAIREPHVRLWDTNNGGSLQGNSRYTLDASVPTAHKRMEAYPEPNPLGRNKRSVWTVPTMPYAEAHFATFPPKLIEPCILAGSHPGDIVLDCFMGAGTTALVAIKHHRAYLGVELNPEYVTLAEKRIVTVQQTLWESEVPA